VEGVDPWKDDDGDEGAEEEDHSSDEADMGCLLLLLNRANGDPGCPDGVRGQGVTGKEWIRRRKRGPEGPVYEEDPQTPGCCQHFLPSKPGIPFETTSSSASSVSISSVSA